MIPAHRIVIGCLAARGGQIPKTGSLRVYRSGYWEGSGRVGPTGHIAGKWTESSCSFSEALDALDVPITLEIISLRLFMSRYSEPRISSTTPLPISLSKC